MIIKAEELSAAQKSAIEQMLGREVSKAESISIRAFPAAVKTESERKAATEKLIAFLQAQHRTMPPVSDEEYEAAYLEAMRSVRPNFTPVS